MEIYEKLSVLFWRVGFYGALTEGGVASLYRGLVDAFVNLGHKTIFASSGPMNLPDETDFYLIEYSKLLRNLPEILTFPYNESSLKAILKIVEKHNPDFFYLHHHDFHYGGSKLKEVTGLPFILHFDSIEYWVKKNWGKLYFGKMLKWCEEIEVAQADAIVTISDVLKKQACEFYNIPPEKVYPVPNGVDTVRFHPEIDGTDVRRKYGLLDKFVVGYSGTFNAYHGVDLLAKSAKKILEEIPNSTIFFIGDGALREKVEEILISNGIRNKVVITGLIPYSEVPKHLAACDVLVSPIVHNHKDEFFGTPIKHYEYKAMGKPIIASNLGTLKEIFEHKVNSYVIESDDVDAIVESVKEIYLNPYLAKSISLNARKDAIEKHSWEVNAKTIIKIYENIIKNK